MWGQFLLYFHNFRENCVDFYFYFVICLSILVVASKTNAKKVQKNVSKCAIRTVHSFIVIQYLRSWINITHHESWKFWNMKVNESQLGFAAALRSYNCVAEYLSRKKLRPFLLHSLKKLQHKNNEKLYCHILIFGWKHHNS